jgi:hypothetical protein
VRNRQVRLPIRKTVSARENPSPADLASYKAAGASTRAEAIDSAMFR